MEIHKIIEELGEIERENGDLYDTVGTIIHSIWEAKKAKQQAAELLRNVQHLENQVRQEFNSLL